MRKSVFTGFVMKMIMIIMMPGFVWAQEPSIYEHNRGETNPALSYSHRPYFTRTPNFRPTVPPGRSAKIFEGGFQTNSFCHFDIIATVEHVFDVIPELLENSLRSIALGIGISFACKTFPNECAIAKNLLNYANLMMRYQQQTCTQVVESAMYDGIAASNDALGACLRDAPSGEPKTVTFNRCYSDPGGIPLPNGERAGVVPVLATLLESVGVSAFDAAEIQKYAGEFTYTADGAIFSSQKRVPGEAALGLMSEKLELRREVLTRIVGALRGGGTPSGADLQAVQLPGIPTPIHAYEAIAAEGDPELRAYQIETLASNLAYAQARWELLEHVSKLEKAVTSSNLPPSQRQAAEAAVKNLQHEVTRLGQMKAIINEASPSIDELLRSRARQLQEAAAASATVAPPQTPSHRYGGQTTWGYTQ